MDLAAGGNPYPGLRPFQADETHLFFGRDKQRIELLQRLRRSRFLTIVGTSGSGKSSLVRAGLLPGLHGGFMAGPSDRWHIVDMRPGTDAIGNLARALDAPGALRDEPRANDEPSFTEATLRRSGLGLVEAVREARLPGLENVLVLVDQFEELFRAIEAAERPQSSDDANAFVKLLLEAAKQLEQPIYIVLTMRSDFLGECSRFRDLPEAINDGQYLVPRLTRDQRIEAITGPPAVFGVALSSTLVNRLLNDVGDNPDQLPILQHALMRTWDQWNRHSAVGAVSKEVGLPDYDGIGGMARALSLHADAVFEGLADQRSPGEAAQRSAIAAKLFKCLAGIGAGGLPIRRLAKLQEIVDVTGAPVEEVISVIDAFRAPGQSFLMPPAGEPLTPDRYVDISHESLIRNWARMKTWVDDEAESARVYERLSSTAVLHEKGEAGLWDQPDLGVALEWRDNQRPNFAWAARYNATFGQAMTFLDASRARAEADEDAKSLRRRTWGFSSAMVFCLMLTGILTSVRDDLEGADITSWRVRESTVELTRMSAAVELSRRRASGTLETGPPPVCTSRENATRGYSAQEVVLDALCERRELATENQQRIGIYELVLEGRWRQASQAISQMAGSAGTDEQLLLRLASVRWPTDRSDRESLLKLQGQANTMSPAEQRDLLGSVVHPVHRRMAEIMTRHPPGELLPEEELLLSAYRRAEYARASGTSFAARDRGEDIVKSLLRQPHAEAYADMAFVALNPQSKMLEELESLTNLSRKYSWGIGLFMVWPLWRLRRIVQHRLGSPIRTAPHPLRCAAAVLFDLAIAAGIAGLAGSFVSSSVAIAGFLLTSTRLTSGVLDAVGAISGLAAAAAYVLLRDAIRLRFRRSFGKALFDLRPLVSGAAFSSEITWRASVKRNVILPLGAAGGFLVLGILFDFTPLLDGLKNSMWEEWLFLLAVTALPIADTARSWIRNCDTFVDRWSKTRVVDAESTEALAVRP